MCTVFALANKQLPIVGHTVMEMWRPFLSQVGLAGRVGVLWLLSVETRNYETRAGL